MWHSARIFKELTGKAPFDYIRSIRLTKAAEKIKNAKINIADVAFDFVFDSHEGFTRAFSKKFGMTPVFYSKNSCRKINLFLPPRVSGSYYNKLQREESAMKSEKKMNTVFVQVVERPERKLILKRGKRATHYYEYCQEAGCDVWDILSGIKEAIFEPIGMWLPANLIKPGTSVYAQGVEVPADYSGPIPSGYEIIGLAPCKMMVFQGPPYDDEKFEDAISDIWELMKTYNPELYGYKWADETGPRFQLAPFGYRGYIEARPVMAL